MDTTTATTTTLLTSTTQSATNNQDSSRKPGQTGFIVYVVVMTMVVVVGLIGNVLTIFVLRCLEHKNKVITPLMINLALADVIIIVFGYPVVVVSNFTDHNVLKNRSLCVWSGFINGSVGIASIANMTAMSFVMLHSFNRVGNPKRVPTKKMAGIIIFTWLYGVLAMFPPLVGWNKFVPGTSGISCCPNWLPDTKAGLAYNALLVFVGFVFPLTTILICYYKIYRLVDTHSQNSLRTILQNTGAPTKKKLFKTTFGMELYCFSVSF